MDQNLSTFYPKDRAEWRQWLQKNHFKENSVWLIYYKRQSKISTISYSEAVDEALCFGWIDGKAKPIDDQKFMQFFCKRKAKSVWSKVNKEKVERLIGEGLMTEAGLQSIKIAKENGAWFILDSAEALIIPEDLSFEFKKKPDAEKYFSSLSRSDKRNILQWLVMAKRSDTRQNRINEIVDLASKNQKPKQFNRPK